MLASSDLTRPAHTTMDLNSPAWLVEQSFVLIASHEGVAARVARIGTAQSSVRKLARH
jgi:hypothetical protein